MSEETQKVDVVGEWVGSSYQRWAYKYLNNNLWRIQHRIGSLQDALQEAAIEFILVKNDPKIMSRINSPQQFMSYYQRSLMSLVTNISLKDSRSRATLKKIKYTYTQPDKRDLMEDKDVIGINASFDRSVVYRCVQDPIVRSDAELNVILNESSSELKQVLTILINSPVEIMEMLRKEASNSTKQFWNAVLRYCNIPQDKSAKLMKELEDRLS